MVLVYLFPLRLAEGSFHFWFLSKITYFLYSWRCYSSDISKQYNLVPINHEKDSLATLNLFHLVLNFLDCLKYLDLVHLFAFEVA